MTEKKLLDLPDGFPQPDDPENIAYFPALDTGYATDIFDNDESLAAALASFKEALREKAPGIYSEEALDTMANIVMEDWIKDLVDRHYAPFFSEGVKTDLEERGIPTTKVGELRESLPGFWKTLNPELALRSIEDIAEDISEGVLLDSPYYGNYCGYPATLVAQVLRELVAAGKLKPEGKQTLDAVKERPWITVTTDNPEATDKFFTRQQIEYLLSLADWRTTIRLHPNRLIVEVRFEATAFQWLPTFTFWVSNFSDLCQKLDRRIGTLDADEETYKLLGRDGHGIKGAPFSMLAVHHEVEVLLSWLDDLSHGLKSLNGSIE